MKIRALKNFIIAIWCVSLFAGGATHIFDNIYFGLLPYEFAPTWLNIYWSSLGILDFLAIFLLLKHYKYGIILTIGIMLSNVIVNSLAFYSLGFISDSLPLQLQTLFLGFCLGSAFLLWQPMRASDNK